ncbi:DUF4255 domain-containing protein [[Clostridium] polysaccharolyticum]|jgi:hypothetical protein|uniref:Pvc16 N-terminal domain-containing protein n=1 Tax=[Clostridium] polysaccharolyticum TaxID=29364 RepID=A0A1I0CA13_9FIRM|nr:DUF4255 domain-containing protein [[Clostridium] polysaccharolyticum]SET16408.1 Protein of unknown function [[Clostridium] polysaccharolyticum]
MGSYNVIEEIGSAIIELLRTGLVPVFLKDREEIDLCSPDEHGDLVVGVSLYDIQENEDVNEMGMQNKGLSKQVHPSMFLDLHYMITVYSKSDIKYRAREEQRLLGRIMQILNDNRIIPDKFLANTGAPLKYAVRTRMEKMTFEEKSKLFNGSGKSCKSSLFYCVFPVELESTGVRKISRVTDMGSSMEEAQEKG